MRTKTALLAVSLALLLAACDATTGGVRVEQPASPFPYNSRW
jgi:starvation-inducible outer membrane lipoprotein